MPQGKSALRSRAFAPSSDGSGLHLLHHRSRTSLGLALKPQATKLAELVNQFLLGVSVLPGTPPPQKPMPTSAPASWKRAALATMDMLVAAHASPRASPLSPVTVLSVASVPASASPTGPNPYDLRQRFHCFYRATHHCKGNE